MAVGLILAWVLAWRHRRQVRKRHALREQLATASRQLAAVLLHLETTELAALQLEGALAKRGSGSVSAKGNKQVNQLRRIQEQLLPQAVDLQKRQRELESRLPDAPATRSDATSKDVKAFADDCASLLASRNAVEHGASFLSDSATAVDAWDAEATPLLQSGAVFKATVARTGQLDEPEIQRALGDFENVKNAVLAAGAARAKRAKDSSNPDSDGPTPSNAQIAAIDLGVLVKASRHVENTLQRLMFGTFPARLPRRLGPTLPSDLVSKSPITGIRLRSLPTWKSRPLVAERMKPAFDRDEVPMTVQGLSVWWEQSIKSPEEVAQEKAKADEQHAENNKPASAGQRLRKGLRVTAITVCTIVMTCAILSVGFIAAFAQDSLAAANRGSHITVVHSPHGAGFPSVSRLQAALDSTHTYVPIRVGVVTLPAAPGTDKATKDPSSVPKATPGHPLELALRPISSPALQTSARATVQAVRKQAPQLYDPRTGDLKHDAMVLGLRPVSAGRGTRYRAVSLAWGPTPAVERTHGFSTPHFSNVTADAAKASSALTAILRQQLAHQFGAPRWLTAPTTTAIVVLLVVGLGIACIKLLNWLKRKPWTTLGAGGRRRRDSDRLLAATTQTLLSAYSREDEASLDALLAANAAGTMPDGTEAPSAQARTDASGIGNVPEASIEAERERVLTRTQASALRRAEELASYTSEVRSSARFADDVQDLADLVSGLQNEHQDTQGVAERYLSTLVT